MEDLWGATRVWKRSVIAAEYLWWFKDSQLVIIYIRFSGSSVRAPALNRIWLTTHQWKKVYVLPVIGVREGEGIFYCDSCRLQPSVASCVGQNNFWRLGVREIAKYFVSNQQPKWKKINYFSIWNLEMEFIPPCDWQRDEDPEIQFY